MNKKNILVLCTGNSCRSQMAEAWLRKSLGDKANVYSAGVEVHGLNPDAVSVMAEAGIDISGYRSKHVDELKDINFDYIITVCDHAKENCPYIPGKAIRLHKSFADPAKANGNTEEVLKIFRQVRDQIKEYAISFALEFN